MRDLTFYTPSLFLSYKTGLKLIMSQLVKFFQKSYHIIILPVILLAFAYYLIVIPLFSGDVLKTIMDPLGAALILMLINTIYLESIFTTPKDSIVNSLNALVLSVLIYFTKPALVLNAQILLGVCTIVFITGWLFVITYSRYSKNMLLLRVSSNIGRAKVLFFIVALLSFVKIEVAKSNLEITSNYESLIYVLVYFIAFIILSQPGVAAYVRELPLKLFNIFEFEKLGIIIGNYSPNIVFVQFPAAHVRINDLIYLGDIKDKSNYDNYDKNKIAMIIDFVGMETEKNEVIGRAYLLGQPQRNLSETNKGLIKTAQECFKIHEPGVVMDSLKDDRIKYYWNRRNDLIGLVSSYSKIDILKGDIIRHQQLENAQLVSVINDSVNNPIRYQIIEGETHRYESDEKNDYGYTKLTGYQLGEWRHPKDENNIEDNKQLHQFFGFQWVPQINSPIFKWNKEFDEINISDSEADKSKYYKMGNIPNTNLPIYLNIQDMVSHHAAILGVTGSGKSTLVLKLLNEILKQEVLVLCIDITGEYGNVLTEYEEFFDEETKKKWDEEIRKITVDKLNETEIRKIVKNINTLLKPRIDELRKLKKICIVDIPELSNTKFSLDFTQYLIGAIINFSKDIYLDNFQKKDDEKDNFKCCLILEEAHTLVPENLGVGGDFGASKAVIDKLSQVALQGRKYNVGFILISQRTATVKKTVLNQCNTMVSFRAYDETSFNFLSSYFGEEYVKEISHLKNDGDSRYVIVAGKAVVADRPIIVEIRK